MKIKDIKDDAVRAKAIGYAIKADSNQYPFVVDMDIDIAFPWDNTAEGYKYWGRINSGLSIKEDETSTLPNIYKKWEYLAKPFGSVDWNKLGEEGWELVAGFDTTGLIFKRQKIDQNTKEDVD